LIFVRHGETESNAEQRYMGHLDSPLSERGLAQVAAVAARLGNDNSVSAIYTSDLGRAASTADAIAEACGQRVISDVRLRERNAGVFQGLRISEARERFPDHFAATEQITPTTAIPEGESALQVQARLVPFLEEVCQRHPGQSIVLVTHGGVIRTMLWHLLESSYATARWARVDNTSLSVFRREEGRWALQTWNDTGHVQNP
ncbi:histidine phosphatase family protein, partial [Candidatus Bipolaricaulota bacterium]|nr:histidine phosphatase family protein [Candidatus Bipolaricaulota bacterium]